MPSPKMDIESIVASKKNGSGTMRVIRWLLVLAAIGAVGWFVLRQSAEIPENKYVSEPAFISDIRVTVAATGTVEPLEVIEISSELSGTVVSVEVDFNDKVEAGQVLARLNTDQLEVTLEQAQATLAIREARVAEAEATYDESRTQYERAISLQSTGVISLEQLTTTRVGFQRAEASLNMAKAEVRIAQASLRTADANLAKACICSTIDGVILDMDVVVGQIVQLAIQIAPLFSVSEDLEQMALHVDIDEADIGSVDVGNPATFSVEAYQGERFDAVISEIRYSPQTIEGVVTYKAILRVDNADMRLLPGMTATAEILVSHVAEALVVSNAAFRFTPPVVEAVDEESGSGLLGVLFSSAPSFAPSTRNEPDAEGRRIIWVMREDELTSVKVRPGASDGIVTEILDGEISPGDTVITDIEIVE